MIILDGAMGTEIERRGGPLNLPLWSAQVLLDDPGLVRAIHRDYLEAGAQVLTTNTFRTHARSLAAGGIEGRARELTQRAVRLAREARDEVAARDPEVAAAVIAGSLSPLEDCLHPERSPPADRALPEHRALAEALAAGGAELLLIETMGRIDECRVAVLAAATTGLPIWVSVVGVDRGGEARLLGGEGFPALVAALADLPVQALLLNCTQVADLPVVLPVFLGAAAASPLALGLYPHTGHQDPGGGWQTHAIDAEAFAELLAERVAGSSGRLGLIGSCCGSTPAWTAALARRLHRDAAARSRGFAELAVLLAAAPGRRSPQGVMGPQG